MNETKNELEAEISRLVADFHHKQLGEKAKQTRTSLLGDVFAACALDCLTPAEKELIRNEKNWALFQESKMRQFSGVKHILKNELESRLGCEIRTLYSIIDKSGVRFDLAILSENIETKLIQAAKD